MRHRRRFRNTSHRSRHTRHEVLSYSPGTSFAIGLFSTALLALAVSPHIKRLEVKAGVSELEPTNPEKKD